MALGLTSSLAVNFVVLLSFYICNLTGINKITLNTFNEMVPELIILTILFPCAVYGFIKFFQK